MKAYVHLQWESVYELSLKVFFFDWANMIACDHVNISLVSHNKQKSQEQTQVKNDPAVSQQVHPSIQH